MPPPKARLAQEDSKVELLNFKDKSVNSLQPTAARGRRTGPHMANGTSSKEASTPAAQPLMSMHGLDLPQHAGTGIPWSSMDRELLQAYRSAYRLDTPSSFKSPLSHIILNNSSVGKNSPTMTRKKSKRRVTKDQLALAVRKNFNALAVNENDVIVNTLYTVRLQDKPFRMRFAPERPR